MLCARVASLLVHLELLLEEAPPRSEGARTEGGVAEREARAEQDDARDVAEGATRVHDRRRRERGARHALLQCQRLVEPWDGVGVAPLDCDREEPTTEAGHDEEAGLREDVEEDNDAADDGVRVVQGRLRSTEKTSKIKQLTH